MKRFLVLFILVLGAASVASSTGEKLRYAFVKGKTYKYQIHTDTKVSGSMGGMDFTAETKLDLVVVAIPSGAAAGGTELVASLESAKSVVNIPVMGMRDTTIDLAELLGKRVKIVVTDLGKALSVTPIDSLPSGQRIMMAGVSPTEIFRNLFLQLPEKEVEVSGSWKDTRPDTTKTGGMTIVTKPDVEYRVTGTETRNGFSCWKIAMTGKSVSEGSGTARGMDVTIDGTTKIVGTVLFAPAAGVMVNYEATTDIDRTQTFTGAQTGSQTMTIKVISSSTLLK